MLARSGASAVRSTRNQVRELRADPTHSWRVAEVRNLVAMYNQADETDRREGLLAYERYNIVLKGIARAYNFEFENTVAAFVQLSPNNDYYGNLRSLVSVMRGIREGVPLDRITVSTYKTARDRAYRHLAHDAEFPGESRGPKIIAFYHNIVDPKDPQYVTIDGHMVACWAGLNRATMKESLVSAADYRVIESDLKELAAALGLVPCQLQATLWFARKRVLQIRYNGQFKLFDQDWTDQWGTVVLPENIIPFPNSESGNGELIQSNRKRSSNSVARRIRTASAGLHPQ